MNIIKGRVHKFGNDINTDDIISARYLNTIDPKELGSHCMEIIDAEFFKKVKDGDIIVAGKNFGCGSSREHAPISIKGAGIALVIAESFARIFYRNCINTGLPIIELKPTNTIEDADVLKVNLKAGEVKNISKNTVYNTLPFTGFISDIIEEGGLINWAKTAQSKISRKK